MGKVKTLKIFLKNPKRLIKVLGDKGVFNFIPDKPYLKMVYWAETGKKLNLDNPKTYNEKLQWLKLHDKKPEYCTYVDKYDVRSYIRETIGDHYLVPLLGVYNSIEEIDWASLPNQFVLKCTHGSGSNIICTDKSKLDIKDAEKKINKWMKKNWYWFGREWPYKNLKPRIICEKYLQDDITDYKFMCFHGEPKVIQVHRNRQTNHTLDFYDINWNKTEIRRHQDISDEKLPKPKRFDEMISIARKLSENEIHVRIDLFEVDGKIYFSEKTYYSASGFSLFEKDEYDELLGSWIQLPINS